jgi:hypothetical protein
MSEIADKVFSTAKKLFPHLTITKEKYINYKGCRLFFDFYVRELDLYIEVQGQQHYGFNSFFHSSCDDFKAQKYRDNLKIQYIQENSSIRLLRFRYDDKITEKTILKKFHDVFNSDNRVV